MIFDFAIRREFTQSASAISIALLAILISTQLIRFLNEAASGKVLPEAVLVLLGFASLQYLPIVLTLTLFIAVLFCLTRVYRDSEMFIWLISGQSLAMWIKPILFFALPFVAAISILSFSLAPWASRMSNEYRLQLSLKSELSQMVPGTFREVKRGKRVFFVENVSENSEKIGNVFVADVDEDKISVVVSKTGYQEIEGDRRFIVLEEGRRYFAEPGQIDFKINEFERYKMITEDGHGKRENTEHKRKPFFELIKESSNAAKGEILWRFSVPLSAVFLVLWAIPLSRVNPRAGRSANLMVAVLIYAIYNNSISVFQTWVAQGKISFYLAFLILHGTVFLLWIILFLKQMQFKLLRKNKNV